MLIEFCIPAYNEEQILRENVLKLLTYLTAQDLSFNWQIVLIINGSSDRSLEIAEKLASDEEKIKIKNIPLPGKGRAQKTYFLESSADILIYTDADLAVSLDNLKDLIAPILDQDYDLVIGSRLLAESKIERSFAREFVSQTYNFLSRLILSHHFADLQCGFKAFKREVFTKLAPNIQDNFWFFDTELVVWAQKLGYKIKEIPVDWQENRYDKRRSKVRVFHDSWKFFENLIRLRLRIWQKYK